MIEEIFRACDVDVAVERGPGLKGLYLNLRKGEILGILGNHYSGKAALLDMMMGDVEPEHGVLFFRGKKLESGGERPVITRIGDRTMMVDGLTLWENIYVMRSGRSGFGPVNPRLVKKLVGALLEEYELNFDMERKAGTLSYYERLLLELFQARLRKAEIILIDNLILEGSIKECELLRQLMGKLKSEGVSFVITSYQAERLPSFTDRMAYMIDGRVVKYIDMKREGYGVLRKVQTVIFPDEELRGREKGERSEAVFSLNCLDIGFGKQMSLELYRGEFTTVLDPAMVVYSALRARTVEGKQAETSALLFQGRPFKRITEGQGVLYVDITTLDQVIEGMNPVDYLCLGLNDKLAILGVGKRGRIQCLIDDFAEEYGNREMLEHKTCRGLRRKERIALNLFRIRIRKPSVIFCNDINTRYDLETCHIIRNSLQRMMEGGACVCMVSANLEKIDEGADQYVMII